MRTPMLFPTTELETVRATLTEIRWQSGNRMIAKANLDPESRYGLDGKRRPVNVTILGTMADPRVGQEYELTGTFSFNAKYRTHELRFESYRTLLPSDTSGIVTYLINVAKWVGPVTAEALVEAFGADTLTVIEYEPDKVAAAGIAGLTDARVREMQDTLLANKELESAQVELVGMLGGVIGHATVAKVLTKWGREAPARVRANPYDLTEIHGVGFRTADAVAQKLGIALNSPNRHRAAVLYLLEEVAAGEGHTVVDVNRLAMEGQRLIGSWRPETVTELAEAGLVWTDRKRVAHMEYHLAEKYVADRLARMATDPVAESDWPGVELAGLADDQVAAVQKFNTSNVLLLVGAPGTGKTFTVARIVESMGTLQVPIYLCAPTGKGAKQMEVALGGGNWTASTVHALLGATINEDGDFSFAITKDSPLEPGLFVLDEASMCDVGLMAAFLSGVPDGSRLLIVGDHYQLPSVGPGAVLRDLIDAGLPHYELTEIKRNAGRIVLACHAIKNGQTPDPAAKLDLPAGANWRHLETSDEATTMAYIRELLEHKLEVMGVDPVWGAQIISPVNERGGLSCDALNAMACEVLNENPRAKGQPFAAGDKVVRCKNAEVKGFLHGDELDSKIRVVNGDLGTVIEVSDEDTVVNFRYPGRTAHLPRKDHHLKLAYAMTCHKLQGSECEVVILPVSTAMAHLPMVNREWLYTAFSRAKKFLITLGEIAALPVMIRKVGNRSRVTRMAELYANATQVTKGTNP